MWGVQSNIDYIKEWINRGFSAEELVNELSFFAARGAYIKPPNWLSPLAFVKLYWGAGILSRIAYLLSGILLFGLALVILTLLFLSKPSSFIVWIFVLALALFLFLLALGSLDLAVRIRRWGADNEQKA